MPKLPSLWMETSLGGVVFVDNAHQNQQSNKMYGLDKQKMATFHNENNITTLGSFIATMQQAPQDPPEFMHTHGASLISNQNKQMQNAPRRIDT